MPLDPAQGHYLAGVLRLTAGDRVLAFNGTDGEWQSTFAHVGKKAALRLEDQARPQTASGDLHYLFAPLKRSRLDYMVQKAVEMGAGRLSPVITRRTQVARVNLERMRANAVEAAEQCGVLSLPAIDEPAPLAAVLSDWPAEAPLVFCDEDAPASGAALDALRGKPIAVLIGPEGGFDREEREALLALPAVVRLSLGPRILRADTAAVAALALVQAAAGDWRGPLTDD